MESEAATTTSKTLANQPSDTAQSTAFMRALAARDEREEIRGADHLAELFQTEDKKRPLQDPAARSWVMKNKVAPGMYEFMIARTAFFDGVFESALRGKTPQIVFLGSGYDSRPYRFRDLISGTRIFELDSPPTQERKKAILRQADIAVPEQVTFVPIDFNTASLSNTLLDAGLDRNRAALFVWEGVTYYLSSAVVDETLRSVASIAPPGSQVCFDYASLSLDALAHTGVVQLRGMMKSNHPAEPTRFGIPAGTIEAFLSARGYAVVEHLTSGEMENRFLTLRDGSSAGKVPSLFCLVRAKIGTLER